MSRASAATPPSPPKRWRCSCATSITPPLPQSEQEPARLLGRERFDVFVAQVGRRLAGDQRLVSEVLESIANNEPDLFATATDDAPLRRRPTARDEARSNGHGGRNGRWA